MESDVMLLLIWLCCIYIKSCCNFE